MPTLHECNADITLIIPVYNLEKFLAPMLGSLKRQNVGNYIVETIFVLNNCTDDSEGVIRRSGLDCKIIKCEILGCGPARNAALEIATGEYIWFLDGDDWLLTDAYNRAVAQLFGEDCVYIDLQINNGYIFHLAPETRKIFCAPTTKFVRREFAKGIWFPEDRINDGDWFYNEELLARNPNCKYTGIVAYHYNNPREGSLYDRKTKGLI